MLTCLITALIAVLFAKSSSKAHKTHKSHKTHKLRSPKRLSFLFTFFFSERTK
ncbi:MAG: hypothetical protein IJV98_07935 [Clostridia bacterium]|nr:hypothetical protein [Clostridia bacterium]